MKHLWLKTFAHTPAAAVLLVLAVALVHLSASALSLGRVTVQSALGEPLRAQIDVTGLTAEEAATLAARIVSPEAFRAAGAEFNAALTGARAEVVRANDGRAVIQISGERKVAEPFLDVVLDVNWRSGTLQRAYTLLIDPPRSTPAPATVAAAPAFTAAPPPVASRPRPEPKAPPAPQAGSPGEAPKPVAAAPRPAPAAVAASEYRVRAGDTLSRIASRHKAGSVSLDQMLVALYRDNPDAFVGSNMNRLKAGVVLRVPASEAAAAVPPTEARQVIQAQSADFHSYRQKLAGAAATTPAVQAKEPTRQVTGKVQTQVDDRKTSAAPPPPDQLKLSQGAVKGAADKAGEEARIAAENQRKASETRMAELTRNVEALKQLAGASAPPGTAGHAASQVASVAAPALTVPTAPPLPPPVSLAAAASKPLPAAVAASGPAAKHAASAPKVAPAPPAPAQTGWLESLSENPMVIPALAAAVVGLAVIVLMRLRRRNDAGFGSETSFLESKLQPDSFFGTSGGQRIDTHDSTQGAASSLSYSLSQLDAIGDVDPVAEADVYLAYGRDLQAEEILKEALRADPSRVAVRAKLLEVYAKRADAIGFELQAEPLRQLVGADSPEWLKAQAMGRELDPGNPLYGQDAARPVDFDTSTDPPPDLREPAPELPPLELPAAPPPVTEPQPLPVLDMGPLDFPVPAADATQPLDVPLPEITPSPTAATGGLDIDLNAPPSLTGMELTAPAGPDALFELTQDGQGLLVTEPQPLSALRPEAVPVAEPVFDLQLDDDDTPAPVPAAAPVSASVPFDFGDLSLELDAPAPAAAALDDEALTRKLDLADEFRQIGDVEGARDLIDEVLAQAEGPLRERAQALRDQLA